MPSALHVILVAVLVLAGCGGPQSALDPGGRDAGAIGELSQVLFIGGTVIFLAVMALAAWAFTARDALPGGRMWVIGGGLVFPVITLSALQVYEFGIIGRLSPQGPAGMTVEVVGKQWWWDVTYGQNDFRTANEITIPVGQAVTVVLRTEDVIHSFWVPGLAGKVDMVPGHVNHLTLTAERAGLYRGQCAEYCGAQHALMAFYVRALPADEFEAWLSGQRRPAAEPALPLLAQGRQVFEETGCGACHTVRGTPAAGVIGPDLTHVGSRASLGAGILPNTVGALAGWIASSQHIKPENRMPSFNVLDGPSLRALAAYLESLK